MEDFQVEATIFNSKDWMTFKFLSMNAQMPEWKIIQFVKLGRRGFYCLTMGDLLVDGSLDNLQVHDARHENRVLMTLAAIIGAWIERFPRRKVMFQGLTPIHTRLYRMAINKLGAVMGTHLEILGMQSLPDGGLQLTRFEPSGGYKSYLVQHKLPSIKDIHPP
jgi:hypothetical protein